MEFNPTPDEQILFSLTLCFSLSEQLTCQVPIMEGHLCGQASPHQIACPQHFVRLKKCGAYKRIDGTNLLMDKNYYIIGYREGGVARLKANDEVNDFCNMYHFCFRPIAYHKSFIPLSDGGPLRIII